MLKIWNVHTYICTDKLHKNEDSDWQVKVKVILRSIVSRPVRPGTRHPSRTRDQFFPILSLIILFDSFGFVNVGCPLWREVVSVLFSFCRALPAQPLSGLSPTGLMSIVYCLYFWDSQPGRPGSCIYFPQEQGSPVIQSTDPTLSLVQPLQRSGCEADEIEITVTIETFVECSLASNSWICHNIDGACLSETSVVFQETTRRLVSEERSLGIFVLSELSTSVLADLKCAVHTVKLDFLWERACSYYRREVTAACDRLCSNTALNSVHLLIYIYVHGTSLLSEVMEIKQISKK
jgi:hypothetical protein